MRTGNDKDLPCTIYSPFHFEILLNLVTLEVILIL
jgi:hypothetical protein